MQKDFILSLIIFTFCLFGFFSMFIILGYQANINWTPWIITVSICFVGILFSLSILNNIYKFLGKMDKKLTKQIEKEKKEKITWMEAEKMCGRKEGLCEYYFQDSCNYCYFFKDKGE